MKIKVSIIIPIFNVENYLEQCLDSVLNQTLKEIEIICIDDGSTDNSPKILEEFAKKDDRIKIVNKKNAGLGAARNTGMEYTTGEYIGFVDSDDWVDTSMFEKLYKNAKVHNSDIVMCPILLVNESNDELNRDTSYFDLECFKENFYNCAFDYKQTKNFVFDIAVNAYNKIYRTEFLNNNNAKFPEGLIFEDVPFFYQTYLSARKVSLIKDFLIFHRVNRASSIISKVDKHHFDIIKIQNLMMESFLSLPNFEDYKIKLLNKKIFRIIGRYFELTAIHRNEFFELIKQDFEKMNLKDDILDDLYLGMKKHYQNVINSYSYREFELREEKDDLSYRINKLEAENKKLSKNNILKLANNEIQHQTTYDYFKYKLKNIAIRIKFRNLYYFYILFNRNNHGLKNVLINIKGYRTIKKNNLVDTTYYLKNNADIRISGMDPILHYMYFGFKENRKPNKSFDGDYYLKKHGDVKKSKINPLVHYSLYGIKEGRKTQINPPNEVLNKNLAKKLIISFCFPPYADTSANVMAKRVCEDGDVVDVIQNDISDIRSVDSHSSLLIEELIENQIIIDSSSFFESWTDIYDFCKKGMKKINEIVTGKGEYEEIYSRTMFPASHFLAFEYKIKYPNVKWTAEFSNPLIYDTEGKVRESKINDQKFLDKVNNLLLNNGFPEYKDSNLYFLCEYLPYVFADKLIFTNENQKKFMISKFPIPEIEDIIDNKAQIKRHPTLKKKFYYLSESDYQIDNNYVNLAYFGRDYETRNLKEVFYALYGLKDYDKNKCKIHFFTSDVENFKESMECSPIRENLEVNSYVSFLEFLNLTTKFDCLIVNDARKKGEINPYLPSKLSDYLGSETDIWVIYEEGSEMSKFDVKYKSIIGDINSLRQTFKQIIQDHPKS